MGVTRDHWREDAVTKFFMGLRVSQRQEDGSTESIVPKRNTLEFFRSMLKQFILMETNSTPHTEHRLHRTSFDN